MVRNCPSDRRLRQVEEVPAKIETGDGQSIVLSEFNNPHQSVEYLGSVKSSSHFRQKVVRASDDIVRPIALIAATAILFGPIDQNKQ